MKDNIREIILFLAILAAALIGGFFVLNQYIYNQKQAGTMTVPTPYRGTLSGAFVCLPPPPGSAVDVLQCTPALQTDQDEYFVVDFNLMSQAQPDLQQGDRFTASGVITPIEYLSTDHWQKYPVEIEGIFSITDSVQKQ